MNIFIKTKFLFIVLLLLIFSCKKEIKQINRTIIYVPKTISSIPILELDNIQVNNISIKIEFYQDHIMAMAEFIQGKIDIFMTGFTQGVANYYGNNNIMHIVTPVWGVSSLITNDTSLKKINDFIGKTILVPFANSPLNLQLKAIIKKEGLINKININYSPTQQAIPMLLTNKVDAICVPEPLASKLILQNKAFIVFNFAEKWAEINNGEKRSPQVSMFVKKDFAKVNNKFLKKLVEQIKVETSKIIKEPEKFTEKYSNIFELDDKIIKNGLKNTLFDIPDYNSSKNICKDYLNKIEYSKDQLNDQFFFKY